MTNYSKYDSYNHTDLVDIITELEETNIVLRRRNNSLVKELEQANKRISDYGWAEDARNGNLQGQW